MIDATLADLSAAAYTVAPTYHRGDCYAARSDRDGETITTYPGIVPLTKGHLDVV